MTNNQPEAKVDFKKKQLEFAAFIRTPELNPAPKDVKPERMLMYRELFFNNVEGFISNNFPILRSLYSDKKWFALVQDFFSHHSCSTPHFSEIPEEFLSYLQTHHNSEQNLSFTLELAHYEWVEMALAIAQEELPPHQDLSENELSSRLIISPLAWNLAYQFPVHLIGPDNIPDITPEAATFLIVYRNRDDDVKFLQVTPLIYRMLEIIQDNPGITTETLLEQLAQEFERTDTTKIFESGRQAISDLVNKSIIFLMP